MPGTSYLVLANNRAPCGTTYYQACTAVRAACITCIKSKVVPSMKYHHHVKQLGHHVVPHIMKCQHVKQLGLHVKPIPPSRQIQMGPQRDQISMFECQMSDSAAVVQAKLYAKAPDSLFLSNYVNYVNLMQSTSC